MLIEILSQLSCVRLDLSRILRSFRRISVHPSGRKPLLIDGKKCDLRLYVLLDRRCTQAYDGICVYSSTRVFVRVCVCARAKHCRQGSKKRSRVCMQQGLRVSDATVPNEAMRQRAEPGLISLVYLQQASQKISSTTVGSDWPKVKASEEVKSMS